MRFPQTYVFRAQLPSGNLALSGANATANGSAVDSGLAAGLIGARLFVQATTSAVAIAAKWQVLDDDGSTWIDVFESQNPTIAAIVTGTGSAVTKKLMLSAPPAVCAGSRSARVQLFLTAGTGAGGTTDYGTIEYDYRAPTNSLGS